MPRKIEFNKACANLARLCDEVVAKRRVVVIGRPGNEDVALVAASELSGWLETAHLLRSPRNATRLLTAWHRAKSGRRSTTNQRQR